MTKHKTVQMVRQVNGNWTKPQPVFADNWEINGCPVNGPAVAADGSRVAVAWFSGAANTLRVKIAFSQDAGTTFSQPIQVDDGENVGRVDTLLEPDGSALVCWLAGNVEGGAIKVRRVQLRRQSWPANGDRTDEHLAVERFSANGAPRRSRAFRMDRIRQAIARSHGRCGRRSLPIISTT